MGPTRWVKKKCFKFSCCSLNWKKRLSPGFPTAQDGNSDVIYETQNFCFFFGGKKNFVTYDNPTHWAGCQFFCGAPFPCVGPPWGFVVHRDQAPFCGPPQEHPSFQVSWVISGKPFWPFVPPFFSSLLLPKSLFRVFSARPWAPPFYCVFFSQRMPRPLFCQGCPLHLIPPIQLKILIESFLPPPLNLQKKTGNALVFWRMVAVFLLPS